MISEKEQKRKMEEKMSRTVFNSKEELIKGYKSLVAAGVIAPLVCCGLIAMPASASAIQTANTEATLGVTLSAEQDDNVTLSSDTPGDSAKEDDMVFHLAPALDMTHFFGDHNLNANLNGDFRKGVDVLDGEMNLDAGVGLDFNFAGGLMIGLSDTYRNEEFDQSLYTEAGLADNRSNTYGVKSAYSFGERTSVEAGYSHKWEEFDDEPTETVYDTDTVNGKVTIPVSREWKSYVGGAFETVDSDEMSIRNSDDLHGVLGFRWEGPSRFSCWIEGGVGEIDYENELLEDYSEVIGETGVEVAMTAWTALQASVGQNSYGELKYEGIFRHNFHDKLELTLGASQNTLRSYVLTSADPTYDVTTYRIGLNSTFWDRIEAGLSASYQKIDRTDSYETLIGKATLDYPIQDWIKTGAHYQ
ncbi:MAG: hypothetical protein D3906_13075, partial [Candidatus Electrothrix sp. AUS1_2]|nr:hypothetical protein [Candidatus Electrothrix sp. AUS1_2]